MKRSKVATLAIVCGVFALLCSLVWAVGSTRISGQAGCSVDLKAYLSGNLSEAQVPIAVGNVSWTYGTGAGAVNVIYADTTTLPDANTVTLDLYASESLLDVFNRDLTMEALKFLYIQTRTVDEEVAADATLNLFGGEATDIEICGGATEIVIIPPGGAFLWTNPTADGLVITTNKNLYLKDDGTGVAGMKVDIIAMGIDAIPA